jgi:NitT/TauT family transport system ATP-binding protein
MNPGSAKISIESVGKGFAGRRGWTQALEDVSLQIREGEFVCLLGASGCGKSTLLNLIAGLEKSDTGTVRVDGEPVRGTDRARMMMFQESALFPWLDVLGNVMFPLRLKPGLDDAERREAALAFLRLVGLEKFQEAHIHELSGGMKQRVALARALAPNPRVLLMDEPFAALDTLTRAQLYVDLQRIWLARHVTIVFVTHNVREAVCLGDRVVVLSPHPGRIAGEFAIELPRPRDINGVEVAEHAARITAAMRDSALEVRQEPSP